MKETTDKWYSTKMLISLIAILLLMNGLINLTFKSDTKIYVSNEPTIEDPDYPIFVTIIQKQKKVPKQKKIKEPEIKITKIEPTVELDTIIDQTIDIDHIPTTNVDTSDGNEGLMVAVAPVPIPKPVKPENSIPSFVEQMPEFPGGNTALLRFLSKRMNYPMFEQEVGLEGKVYVSFVVEPTGKIGTIEVMRSPSKGFSKEATRVIAKMPDWTPGYHNGNAVAVRYSIPISFKLN